MKQKIEKFQEYVATYKESNACGSEETFIKDMIYGIGLSIDKEKYSMASGYKKFKEYLKRVLIF